MSKVNQNKTESILIVDDTLANISVLFNLLVDEGYKVLIAENGESALKQSLINPPDLILLDILMPGIDGFETCKKLQQQTETKNIPIIFMTALSDTEKKVNGFKLGAVDYITKPFQIEEVLARIENHLNLQRLKNKLSESEQCLKQVIEGAMDAIIAVQQDGNIVLFNKAAEQMFQYSANEMIGQPIKPLFSDSLYELIINHLQIEGQIKSSLWISEGHLAIRSNAEFFSVEATLSGKKQARNTLYTLVLRDIDERLKAQQQTRKLQDINQYLQKEIQDDQSNTGLIGDSKGLREVMVQINQVAETDATILVNGETGTGKEVVVQTIHKLSQRKEQPLINLNCAAIPENLIESELFGHEKGAFTGAVARKKGRFELADGGTLFLDEIGEMELNLQSKLLRVLQEGQLERVGGTETISVDVRIITATHIDLAQSVKQGRFREDLYYRLNVFPIIIPPLRNRKQDLEDLALHFLKIYAKKINKPVTTLSTRVLSQLHNYHWPGNVRELQHLIERAVILSSGTELIVGDWFQPIEKTDADTEVSEMEQVEQLHIRKILEKTDWRISGNQGAAELLGLNASTLRSRIKKLNIKRDEF